jgi:hypothetical protein
MITGIVTGTAIATVMRTRMAAASGHAACQRRKQKHRDREYRNLEKADRRLTCERCGQEFGCSRDSIADCWCNAEPYRLPMPSPAEAGSSANCLCPACLREMAARRRATPGIAEQM